MDGVNGLSGFCIIASIMFGTLFYLSGCITVAILAQCLGRALIPFFFHNVSEKPHVMFIGDGSTLVMSTIIVYFRNRVLRSDSPCVAYAEIPM